MGSKEYILVQDIGAYSCTAALFTADGSLVKKNRITYTPSREDDMIWQSPHLWWRSFCCNCKTLLSGIDPADVKVVSVCAQMMACLPVSFQGYPLYDCILWGDRRSIPQVNEISEKVGAEEIYQITGISLSYSFSLSKVLWLKQNHPEIYEKTCKLLQCKDYINYLLTGRMVTDETDAGFTQMYDVFRHCWSDRILNALDLDIDKLPEVLPFGSPLGTLTKAAAEATGLSASTLVIQGPADGRSPSFAAGLRDPGDAYINLSAIAWLSEVTANRKLDPTHSVTKTNFISKDLYLNGGTILSAFLCLDWYFQTFRADSLSSGSMTEADRYITKMMQKAVPGSHGLLFMPSLRGARSPWWNYNAKGGFIGLTDMHTETDFISSIMEGVAFQLGLIKYRAEQLEPFTRLSLMGIGALGSWQQILSDVMEMEIECPSFETTPNLVGTAVVAGVASGYLGGYEECWRFRTGSRITEPREKSAAIYRELLPAFEDCYNALMDINQHLAELKLHP